MIMFFKKITLNRDPVKIGKFIAKNVYTYVEGTGN